MTYSSAYRHWYRALVRNYDQTIEHILLGLMQDTGGLDILINRNPSLNYGSLMKMKCVGINHNYTMSVSLLILAPLSADFDGDTLNILALYNRDFIEITDQVINPEQMYISRNDGLCNTDILPSRDFLICANSLKSIGRYSMDEIAQIEECMKCA